MKAKFKYGIPPFKSPESWGKKSEVSHITAQEGGKEILVGIKVVNDNGKFVIPVIDVRYGNGRKFVEKVTKEQNILRGNKFFKPSYSVFGYSYNASMKP